MRKHRHERVIILKSNIQDVCVIY